MFISPSLWLLILLVFHLTASILVASACTDIGDCPSNISAICDGGKAHCSAPSKESNNKYVHIRCYSSKWKYNNSSTEIACRLPKNDLCEELILCNESSVPCDFNCTTHYRCPSDFSLCAKRSTLCDVNPEDGCGDSEPSCTAGFKCARNGRECVIPQVLVRDGIEDCDDGEDECSMNGNACYSCEGGSNIIISSKQLCNGNATDCEDWSDECLCPGEQSIIPQCSLSQTSHNARSICKPRKILDDVTFVYCQPTSDDNSSEIILKDLECDFVINCPAGDDEANCSDGRHYCLSGHPPFVRARQINDGRVDCSDASDECGIEEGSNSMIFHSRYYLISNQVLFGMVWLMMVVSLIGNMIVMIWEVRKLVKSHRQTTCIASLRANRLLVVNLSASNFLMGIYLLLLGVNYELLRGNYCLEEVEWRASKTCTSMGVLVVISVESSVLSTLILASVRLNSILKPYQTMWHPKLKWITLLILFTWLAPVVVAIIPLTATYQATVPDTIWVPGNPFISNAKANVTTVKEFLRRYSTFYARSNETLRESLYSEIESTSSWSGLTEISHRLGKRSAYLKVKAWLGYYNIHSVCIPDLFPLLHSSHWVLSTAVTNFNFLSFLAVAAIYTAICRKTLNLSAAPEENSQSEKMLWKTFRLAASGFCCWVPIYVLSYTRLAGSSLSGDVYVGTAIILLPLNSALGPLLYSNALLKVRNVLLSRILKKYPRAQKRRNNGDVELRKI